MGSLVGRRVGDTVGSLVGRRVGDSVGSLAGRRVGDTLGGLVSRRVGDTLGDLDGAVVGIRGVSVGASVGTPSARTEEDRWVGAAADDILSSILGMVSVALVVPSELVM